ncbi:hypothetical protein ACFX19_010915 [Malus domestica]
MSYLLPHLHSGWAVDQAILAKEERVVIIRFGHDWDDTCMQRGKTVAEPNPRCSEPGTRRLFRFRSHGFSPLPFSSVNLDPSFHPTVLKCYSYKQRCPTDYMSV